MVEADLGDESYGASGADGDDNGDFGAEGEFEGFDQYGEGNEFDDSMGAAGGSGAAADGKGRQPIFVLQLKINCISKYFFECKLDLLMLSGDFCHKTFFHVMGICVRTNP